MEASLPHEKVVSNEIELRISLVPSKIKTQTKTAATLVTALTQVGTLQR
jgi:hypothetical protein